jgi:outer membrane protein
LGVAVKSVILSFILVPIVSLAHADEKIKIGYIDLQRAVSESQAGKKAKEKFQAEYNRAKADILKEQQEIERLKGEYDKKGALLKEEDKRNLERELQRRIVGLERNRRDAQESLRVTDNELTSQIVKDLEKVVAEVGKNEKFTLILERSQLLYSDQGIDLTPKVVDIYNNRTSSKPTKGK